MEDNRLSSDSKMNRIKIDDIPLQPLRIYTGWTVFQGKREWFKASVRTSTEELITVFPARQ